jgi:hypothetical protein
LGVILGVRVHVVDGGFVNSLREETAAVQIVSTLLFANPLLFLFISRLVLYSERSKSKREGEPTFNIAFDVRGTYIVKMLNSGDGIVLVLRTETVPHTETSR